MPGLLLLVQRKRTMDVWRETKAGKDEEACACVSCTVSKVTAPNLGLGVFVLRIVACMHNLTFSMPTPCYTWTLFMQQHDVWI